MRATPDDVKQILDTSLSDPALEAYITGANQVVTEVLGGTNLSEGLLTTIETWFAAHLVASTRERQSKREEAGSAKIEYTGQYGMGLELTSYGQMVKTLDTTGRMATLGMKRASINAIQESWQAS